MASTSTASKSPVASKEFEIKLDDEEQKEVTRRLTAKDDKEREKNRLSDPAYPANKRLKESCLSRAARGSADSPDGMSIRGELQQLKSNNAANEQAIKAAKDALFAAAVTNKHGAITAVPAASRPHTGLAWLAQQTCKSWVEAVKHADRLTEESRALHKVRTSLTQAIRNDGFALGTASPHGALQVDADLLGYSQGMRTKYTTKCGELQRATQERDAATKALDAAKKRIAELEAAAGLSGMATAAAAAAPVPASAGPSASAGTVVARPVLTAYQTNEAQRLSGIPMDQLVSAVREYPSIKEPIQAIVSLRAMHESSKMRVVRDIVFSVKPPPMGQQPASPNTVTREKYDEMKDRTNKVEKLFRDSGLGELTEDDATIAPEIKACLSLMRRNGGPEICARMVQIQSEQKKKIYHDLLDRMLLKANDILCCRFMTSGRSDASPMYALGVVQNIPHKDTPGAIHVMSMFQNDGVYETGKKIGFCIPPTLESYEVVTKRTVRSFFDKVFDKTNVKHLHKNATTMNYTAKNEPNYRDTLYTHTTGMLINFMQDKRGFFTQYERDCLKDPKAAIAAETTRNAAGRAAAIDLGD